MHLDRWIIPSLQALALVQNEAARTPIDVVLYTDRMDLYRVEPVDEEVLVLAHGCEWFPPGPFGLAVARGPHKTLVHIPVCCSRWHQG